MRYRFFNGGDAGTCKMHLECYGAMEQAAHEEGGWFEWVPGMERPPPNVRLQARPLAGVTCKPGLGGSASGKYASIMAMTITSHVSACALTSSQRSGRSRIFDEA